MSKFKIERAQRLGHLPPYLFSEIDKAKAAAIDQGVDEVHAGDVLVDWGQEQGVEDLSEQEHRVAEARCALLGQAFVDVAVGTVAQADHQNAVGAKPHGRCQRRIEAQAAVRVVAGPYANCWKEQGDRRGG